MNIQHFLEQHASFDEKKKRTTKTIEVYHWIASQHCTSHSSCLSVLSSVKVPSTAVLLLKYISLLPKAQCKLFGPSFQTQIKNVATPLSPQIVCAKLFQVPSKNTFSIKDLHLSLDCVSRTIKSVPRYRSSLIDLTQCIN